MTTATFASTSINTTLTGQLTGHFNTFSTKMRQILHTTYRVMKLWYL